MAKRPQYEIIAETDYTELARTKGTDEGIKELSRYVNILRRGMAIRIKQIEKAGEYSYAFDKVKESNLKNLPASKIGAGRSRKDRRNLLLQEIAKYQSFFGSDTSTVEGIRALNREQDIRIFGVDESGQPKGTLTRDEREEFWSLYMEYEHFDPTFSSKYGSNTAQSLIGDLYKAGANEEYNVAQLLMLTRSSLEQLKASTEGGNIESIANVYAGRRLNIKT